MAQGGEQYLFEDGPLSVPSNSCGWSPTIVKASLRDASFRCPPMENDLTTASLWKLELTRFGGHIETWVHHPRKGSSHAEDESTISDRIQI